MPALDDSLFDMMAARLYVAVISDVLDSIGFRNQVFQPGIVPAQPDARLVLVGRAATVLVGPQYEVVEHPYTNQIAAIDALVPGDVVVSGVSGITTIAVWGELFSNAAKSRGATGFSHRRLPPRYPHDPRSELPRLLSWAETGRHLRSGHGNQCRTAD